MREVDAAGHIKQFAIRRSQGENFPVDEWPDIEDE